MRTPYFGIRDTMAMVVLIAALAAAPANAQVNLADPNGGEVLEVGSVFTIRWHMLIAHNLQNWDLWYSTTGSGGPWTTIAMNLPPGSGAVGSIHTYDWTIPPCVVDDTVWVRVRMDNSGTDYEDVSNAPFSIVLPKTTRMVIVGRSNEWVFVPECLEINTGDTVLWCWHGGDHNVVDDAGAFSSGPEAPAGTALEVESSQDFLAANHRPGGIYDYHCDPHGGIGMVGTIDVVLPPCPADFDGDGAVNSADLAQLLGSWGLCL